MYTYINEATFTLEEGSNFFPKFLAVEYKWLYFRMG